jgi:uncharacterized membrane protein
MTEYKSPKLDTKKEAILKSRKNKINPMAIFLGVLALLSAGAIGYYVTGRTTTSPQPPVEITAGDSQVIYPASMFHDGKAYHFDYKTDDLTIRYFIIKSSDGVIRAAFDACDVCWPAGKGYYQDGDEVVCRNCGRRFASLLVNEVQGGCNPAPLNRTVQGDKLIIKVDDILAGRTYFDFKGKA